MQAQSGFAIWEFVLFWIFTGSGLVGLPPGDRDPALLKSVPPQTLVYFEWAARGTGQAGAKGIDGFAADPEIQQFFDMLDAALNPIKGSEGDEDSLQDARKQLPQLTKQLTAHSGCVFLGFEPPPADPQSRIGNWANLLSGVHGGVVFSTGQDTDAVWRTLNRMLADVPDFTFDESKPTQLIPVPIPGYKLLLHREGQRILFALGEGTLPRIIEGLSGRLPGLETNPRFQNSLQRVNTPRVSTVGWIDGQGLISSTTAALGPIGLIVRPIMTILGIDALDHAIHVAGVEQGTMVQRSFISTGARSDGIMVLAAGPPIQPAQFAHIPADADMVIVSSISLKNVYLEVRKLLATAQPLSVRLFDEAVKQLESELELKIVDDVLPAFGDFVTAFDSPSGGGMIATSLIVSLEVRDAAKANRVFGRLMKLVEQSLAAEHADGTYDESVSLRQQPFLDHTIFYVNSMGRGYGANATISPSFCLTERHLLFAIHPQALKAQLRHLKSGKPSFDKVADRKLPIPAGTLLTYAYLDGPRSSEIFGAVLPFLGQTVINRLEIEGIAVEPFSIPSAAAIAPYFGDSSAVVSRQPDGIFIETRNAPPVLVAMELVSAVKDWRSETFDINEARRRRRVEPDPVQLGPAEGEVVPAVAESKPAPEPPAKPDDPSPYRKLAPLFIKALVPDNMQQLIPDSALRKIEEGPTKEALERRDEARRKREERRQLRRQGRPLAPAPVPARPAPPAPVPSP
ncbi:hypothetical protein [Schlesneria paludicola]|uniref:hypothetical protein n=1 Tax=Schlesneria paludicola TaxID=360056 RepID=UPI00029B4A42|nr:hypothetical protein [Schlesneria paludicola]